MNSHEVFIHIHQGCFAGTGAIVRLPQCQWSKPEGYGKISQCITTTKHSKAKTVSIFLGIYCKRLLPSLRWSMIFVQYCCLLWVENNEKRFTQGVGKLGTKISYIWTSSGHMHDVLTLLDYWQHFQRRSKITVPALDAWGTPKDIHQSLSWLCKLYIHGHFLGNYKLPCQ